MLFRPLKAKRTFLFGYVLICFLCFSTHYEVPQIFITGMGQVIGHFQDFSVLISQTTSKKFSRKFQCRKKTF